MTGCSKKEDKAPSIQPSKQITSIEAVVKVPDNIKGKWKAVNISVYDKQKAKETTYTIGIGSTFALPNTDLSIKVETFFPNFVMKGINLTSETNDLKNPAAQIKIYQGSKEAYKGWLYALYPDMESRFQKFGFYLKLVGVIPA